MKKFFGKIWIATSSIVAILGITSTNAPANIQNSDSVESSSIKIVLSEVQEQSPFYLYHANQLAIDGGEMIAWHTSHASHQSHYSHSSHQSHYSHYSSSY